MGLLNSEAKVQGMLSCPEREVDAKGVWSNTGPGRASVE